MNRIKQGVKRLADIRFDKETGSEQKGVDQMHLPVSVTQDELLEVLLQVAPVRPVALGSSYTCQTDTGVAGGGLDDGGAFL